MAFFSAASYIYLVLTSFKVWREKNRRRKLTKRKLIVQILSFEPKLSTMKFTYVPENSSNTTTFGSTSAYLHFTTPLSFKYNETVSDLRNFPLL